MIEGLSGQFYVGIVEDRNDPLGCGRVRVRVVGQNTHDKTVLPTKMLPWAMIMQPASGGTGASAVGPAEGTTCIVVYNDYPENQYPIVIGTLAGIPQGNPVNVDKFEDTPMYRDEAAPQGRPVPTNSKEVDGNTIGPVGAAPATSPPGSATTSTSTVAPQLAGTLSADKTTVLAPNASLNAIVDQSQTNTTPKGIIQGLIEPTSKSLGAVGGMLGSVNQVGATMNIAKNQYEGLIRQYGNVDQAAKQFVMIASQSGPLGNALSAIFNGKASLKSLASSYGVGLTGIQSSISSIRSATSLKGVLQGAESLIGQSGTLINSGSAVVDTVIQGFQGASVDSTITRVGAVASNIGTQITGEISGTLSAAANSAQKVASGLGLGNVTGNIQNTLGNLGSTAQNALGGFASLFGGSSNKGSGNSGSPLEDPAKVASTINGEFSTKDAIAANAGNIAVLETKPAGTATSADFATVKEGSTPPVNGAYGGPNFGGSSPVLEKPTPIPATAYDASAGSQNPLNTVPPKGYDTPAVRKNIQTLINACIKHGLTTKEQQAALLGIVGGECGWIPQDESCNYSSPDRLCNIFQSTFKGKPELAEKYASWKSQKKGTPAEFFDFVYDPANNGRQLGNTQPGDGGKYYGRGFIQLTGRSNYKRYASLTGHDILNNPDLLNDTAVAADIAVFYLMDRVKGVAPTAHPGYFYSAKKSIGNNSPDIAARKLGFYEHFYGTLAPGSYGTTDRTAGNAEAPNSYNGAMAGNAGGLNDNIGFKDPHGKYPLKRERFEPQTSRLARGVIKDSIVLVKESQRERGVPLALNAGTWDQPNVPFGARYPYNQVRETESGHVEEFDDTPGYERIHRYHKSGTFEEIDANGTLVRKIIGDGYFILERNGFITVAGDCNLTVAGNVNIFCRSDANIEVAGSAEMKVGGNFDIGVARDMNIAVEGNFSVWANGSVNMQAKKNAHLLAVEDMYIASSKDTHIQSTGEMYLQSLKNIYSRATNSVFVETAEAFNVLAHTDINLSADSSGTYKVGTDLFLDAGGQTNIKSGGDVAIDGANVHWNSGVSSAGTQAPASADATKALIHGMVPPPEGAPLFSIIEPLAAPPLHGEEQLMYESTPNGGGSTAGDRYNQHVRQQEGRSSTYESSSNSAAGGGGSSVVPANQKEILACNDFHANYRLSKNFTLGMMFDGGFNAKHKLVAQNDLTPQQIVANLAALCENILEKYLEVLPGGIQGLGNQWMITSGYRMGNGHSDHGRGRAVDISLLGAGGTARKERHHELIQKLDKLVPYDQLILEYRGPTTSWIHTGFKGEAGQTFGGGSNRKMAFTMVDDKTYKMGSFVLVT